MRKKRRSLLTVLMAFWAIVVFPAQAIAGTYELLQCEDGQVVPNTQLFYADAGFPNSFCQYTGNNDPQLDHIFSQVACAFTEIVNDVLGKMYCGMQGILQPIVAILLSLYIMIFGVQILMGTAQLTSKEILSRLLKLSLVWAFISESTWGINMVFRFFVDLANTGVWWAVSAIDVSNDLPFKMYDNAYGGLGDVMPVYFYIDELIKKVITGPFMAANSELVVFFALMVAFQPPVFMIAVYWLWTTFTILVRALISFLMAISALGFLICLSPIFLSLMLFRATYQFFESWLKFMISYSLQIAIVFACIAMWSIAVTQFTGFFAELAAVIFPLQKLTDRAAALIDTDDSLGVCPYIVTMPNDSFDGKPHVKCTDKEFDPIGPKDPTPDEKLKAQKDKKKLIFLSNLNQKTAEDPNTPETEQNALTALIYYIFYYLISMIIVCYAFDALLRKAPEVARQLAGPEYVPLLGQGYGYISYGQPGKGGVRQAFDRGRGGDTGGSFFGGGGGRGGQNFLGSALDGVLNRANQLVETRGKR